VTHDSFTFKTNTSANWMVVRLEGGVDVANARDIETRLLDALGDDSLRLDLSDLSFLDSAGLAMIDRLARALDGRGRSLEVIAAEGSVARAVLRIAAFAGVPVVTESADEAPPASV
jgi:anti-anti-sigma factor